MQTTTVHIYLEDQARRIGSGWRTCELQVGRKWAIIRECATGTKAKLPMPIFLTLKQREIAVRKKYRWRQNGRKRSALAVNTPA